MNLLLLQSPTYFTIIYKNQLKNAIFKIILNYFLLFFNLFLFLFVQPTALIDIFTMKSQRVAKQIFIFSLSLVILTSFGALGAGTNVDYTSPESWDGNCQIGTTQSPIDINTKTLEFCPNIITKFKYLCVATPLISEDLSFTVTSNGAGNIGIKNNVGNGPTIRLYETKQFHFHAPSQHTVNGQSYPLQMHNFFVAMKNQDGSTLTLSNQFQVFSSPAYNNASVYAAVLSYFFYPSDAANAIDLNVKTDANGVAQVNRLQIFGCTSSRLWYHYRGSTTAPPCTETVDWFVYRQPLPIKTSNYNAIKAALNHGNPNARPTQKLNGRKVYVVGEACPAI